MSKVLLGIVIGAFALYAYQRVQEPESRPQAAAGLQEAEPQLVERTDALPTSTGSDNSKFHCDGRTRCPQMTSCEEAMFFLKNCPGVEMDGEGDGIPCERQWCGRH